jgi:hypothetical protein
MILAPEIMVIESRTASTSVLQLQIREAIGFVVRAK